MCNLSFVDAKQAAEKILGFEIDDEIAYSVLEYAAKKCVLNRKNTEYLPILYKNELLDYYTRLAISLSCNIGG